MKKLIVIQCLGNKDRAVEEARRKYARFGEVVDNVDAAMEAVSVSKKTLVVAVIGSGQIRGLDGYAAGFGWHVEKKAAA